MKLLKVIHSEMNNVTTFWTMSKNFVCEFYYNCITLVKILLSQISVTN